MLLKPRLGGNNLAKMSTSRRERPQVNNPKSRQKYYTKAIKHTRGHLLSFNDPEYCLHPDAQTTKRDGGN